MVKTFFWILNIVFAFLLGLSWLAYYLPSNVFNTLSFISFVTPLLLGFHFLYLLFWTFKRDRKVFLSLLFLLVSYFIFGPFFRLSSKDSIEEKSSFSIMSFNVRGLNRNEQLPIANIDSSIMEFIARETPDILVIQEAHYTMRRKTSLDKIYPYKFVDYEFGVPKSGVINALFSKYPIKDIKIIDFPKSSNGALYADIALEGKMIRVFNVHLQSFRVIPEVAQLQNEASGKLFKRIHKGLKKQEEQVLIINNTIKNSPYPVILAGDFNNTQFSKVYRVMHHDMKDSYLHAGVGFGRTFKFFNLPMRIDYIFADTQFEILSHTNYDVELSDHYPIKATLTLNPH